MTSPYSRRGSACALLAATMAVIAAPTSIAASETPLGTFSCTVSQGVMVKFTDRLRKFSVRNNFEFEVTKSVSGTTTIQVWRADLMAIVDNQAAPETFQVRVYNGSQQVLPANSMTRRVLNDLRRAAADVADCQR